MATIALYWQRCNRIAVLLPLSLERFAHIFQRNLKTKIMLRSSSVSSLLAGAIPHHLLLYALFTAGYPPASTEYRSATFPVYHIRIFCHLGSATLPTYDSEWPTYDSE